MFPVRPVNVRGRRGAENKKRKRASCESRVVRESEHPVSVVFLKQLATTCVRSQDDTEVAGCFRVRCWIWAFGLPRGVHSGVMCRYCLWHRVVFGVCLVCTLMRAGSCRAAQLFVPRAPLSWAGAVCTVKPCSSCIARAVSICHRRLFVMVPQSAYSFFCVVMFPLFFSRTC